MVFSNWQLAWSNTRNDSIGYNRTSGWLASWRWRRIDSATRSTSPGRAKSPSRSSGQTRTPGTTSKACETCQRLVNNDFPRMVRTMKTTTQVRTFCI